METSLLPHKENVSAASLPRRGFFSRKRDISTFAVIALSMAVVGVGWSVHLM
jgi:hypothetical protein